MGLCRPAQGSRPKEETKGELASGEAIYLDNRGKNNGDYLHLPARPDGADVLARPVAAGPG